MPLTEQQVLDALRQVRFPGYSRDIVSFGFVKSVAVTGGDVRVLMELATRDPSAAAQIQCEVENALRALPGVGHVTVQVAASRLAATAPPVAGGLPTPQRIEGVKRVIAIGSGKGGVGKSTVAVNLACALQELGLKVGLLDADIYGPTVPKMLGALDEPSVMGDRINPVQVCERRRVALRSRSFAAESGEEYEAREDNQSPAFEKPGTSAERNDAADARDGDIGGRHRQKTGEEDPESERERENVSFRDGAHIMVSAITRTRQSANCRADCKTNDCRCF